MYQLYLIIIILFFILRKRQANNDKIRYKHPFVHLNGNSEEKDGKSTIIGSSTEALYANTLEPDSDKLLAKKSEKESFKNVAYSTGNFRLLLLLEIISINKKSLELCFVIDCISRNLFSTYATIIRILTYSNNNIFNQQKQKKCVVFSRYI